MAKELAQKMAALQFDACQGTVRDRGDFNAETDSEALRKAMKGLGELKPAILLRTTLGESFSSTLSGSRTSAFL